MLRLSGAKMTSFQTLPISSVYETRESRLTQSNSKCLEDRNCIVLTFLFSWPDVFPSA